MNTFRKNAIIVGACYLAVNIVAGPLGLALTEPVLGATDYLVQVSANETNMLIGALLVLVMAVADAGMSTPHIVMQAPLGLQEIALGVWLVVKGFNPSAIASEPAPQN